MVKKNEKKQEKNHQEAHLHMTKLRPSTFVTSFYAGCTEKESYLPFAKQTISSYIWNGKKALDFKNMIDKKIPLHLHAVLW